MNVYKDCLQVMQQFQELKCTEIDTRMKNVSSLVIVDEK